ncbi:MAG: hydrolase [Gammaproteobacteria bacterium]|nr:hydrolase [Gammaproteobacteria bacterium]
MKVAYKSRLSGIPDITPSVDRGAAKYCTQCGGRLTSKWLDADQRQRHVCVVCQHVHYENPRVLVWCYAHWHDGVVFCRRALAPAMGLWAPPAGFVEKGETLEEAVMREVREEAGIELDPKRVILFRVASLPHMNEVYVEFRAELASPPVFRPGSEALEVALFTEANVPRQALAFGDMLPAYPDEFFKCLRIGEFPIKSAAVRVPDVR